MCGGGGQVCVWVLFVFVKDIARTQEPRQQEFFFANFAFSPIKFLSKILRNFFYSKAFRNLAQKFGYY